MKLSKRVQAVKPSPTLAITAKAKAMKAEGIDVVGFGAGEPDFDTPQPVKDAAIQALNEGFTKYTPVPGLPELKKALVAKFKRENGLDYEPDQIIVNVGGKHSFYELAQAIWEEGDEVIIPAPYWVSYPDMVTLSGAKPVILPTDDSTDFRVTPEQLEKAITAKTKGFVFNSPSNPTGSGYTREQMLELAAVIEKHPDIVVVSDEIYERITYDGFKHVSPASLSDKMYKQTMTLSGFSKSYSMTGWRLGYAAGNADVIKSMGKIQGQSTSNPCSFAQRGAVVALEMDQGAVDEMVKAFDERRKYIVERLNNMPGVTCPTPVGAFYVFPNVSSFYGKSVGDRKITDSSELCAYLLDDYKVAAVPGSGFGSDNYVRLSYAIAMDTIKKGLDRIEEALSKIK